MKNILCSTNPEYEQSVIRIVLGGIVMVYLLLCTPYQGWMIPAFSGFLLISFTLSLGIKRFPGEYWWRKIFGQIIDFGAISINIFMCGEQALPAVGVYLWVIIGNGCRFGIRYLISAIAISTLLFTIVAINEPFLTNHKYLALGIGITQLFVPFYFAVLLRRLHETQKRLEFLSEFDELTGLLNRRKFDTLIKADFNRLKRLPAPFSIALVDIDHFKSVNDKLGHLAGDQVLKSVAKSIQQSCRSVDNVARYGGEEFAILLHGLDCSESFSLSDRIRENIAQSTVALDNDVCNVTVSIGVACWDEKYERIEDWIKSADDALYTAKDKGRNMVTSATSNGVHDGSLRSNQQEYKALPECHLAV